jgi:hypothetical protein
MKEIHSNFNLEFIEWVRNEDLIYKQFHDLHAILKPFLITQVLKNTEIAETIALRFEDVLSNCNQITYNEPGVVEAYVILHFLDRYHRFQQVFITLIEHKLLPVFRQRSIEILDIGTGPAPALCAILDMYTLIKQFGKLKDIKELENLQIKGSYVERSQEFRTWLHHFTEYANYISDNKCDWQILYSSPFYDFKKIRLVEEIYDYNEYDWEDNRLYLKEVKQLSYDLVTTSNFFTEEYQLEELSNELKEVARKLRNRGLLVVAGARESIYVNIYNKLSKLVERGYGNRKFKSFVKQVYNQDLKYSYNDRYGILLKDLLQSVFDKLQELNVNIPSEIARKLINTIDPRYKKDIIWKTKVFQKNSKLRKRLKSWEV